MKLLRLILITLLCLVFITVSIAQTPQRQQIIEITTAENFSSIQKSFYDYWAPFHVGTNGYYVENGIRKKAHGWKQFKRWEWYWEQRVDPTTGSFPQKRAADFYSEQPKTDGSRAATGNWTCMGPTTSPGGYFGLGRLNCVAFRPDDNNTIYTGSPSGGLWKTIDGGTNWTVLTDKNDVLGVSDIIVIAGETPATDIIYIGTGDRDGGSMWNLEGGQYNDNNSIGVLKSVDGGTSWTQTDLKFKTNQFETVNRMITDTSNYNKIYAATSAGLFVTENSGLKWDLLFETEFIDLKFMPWNSQIMYGSTRTGSIFRSTDAGISWSNIIDLYASGGRRIEMAVSVDEPTWVYAVIANEENGHFGIYKSINSGASFSKAFDGSNILGDTCDGSTDGGQGDFDLAIAANPNDANIIFVGGINTWKSINGGSAWSINNMWEGTCDGAAKEVHADKHFLAFQNGSSILFECNDGGIYKTTDAGSTWTDLSNGLIISQMYRLGVSQISANEIITGLQDNGTKALMAGTWNDVCGGDGMECLIDYTNENIQYMELNDGVLLRTTDHWGDYTCITIDYETGDTINGLTEAGSWVTPYVIDPTNHETLYLGLNNIWKSTDKGDSWTKISTMNSTAKIRSLAIAPSDNQVIYAADPANIWRTSNGGTSWYPVTGTLPTASSTITYISISNDKADTAWVSMGQYNKYGVFQTTDGGTTWTDISIGLPPIPVMCVIQNKLNIAELELYAATDVGIYVKIGGKNWTLFSNNLPNVVVTELEIYYNTTTPALSRIRAATSGRGLWESGLFTPPTTPPVANFTADITSPNIAQTVSFTDMSINAPSSWTWNITPAVFIFVGGTNANSQNPQVQFNAEGKYTVRLTSANAIGNDIETKIKYIDVTTLHSYCPASGGGTQYISSVQLGNIQNTGTGDDHYSHYSSISSDLTINQAYDITITYGLANTDSDLGIWIDWNKDGDFNDENENVVCVVGITYLTETYSFSVPETALLGATTMRIRLKEADEDCGGPCGTTAKGEVEDYKVIVKPGLNTWIGYTADWTAAINWSEGVVPNSSYNVDIPLSPFGGNFPEVPVGQVAYCNKINMNNSVQVSISGTLVVGDD